MSGRAAFFGPNLRRARIHHGVSLETVARETKVPIALWEGLEENNFVGWPTGIYARAYVREYAELIGVDPDETVNEFCRQFPQGDRRQAALLREHAEIVGHDLAWKDDLQGASDRRVSASDDMRAAWTARSMRIAAASFDSLVVLSLASVVGLVTPFSLASRIVVASAGYYAAHVVTGGRTPAFRLLDKYLQHSEFREMFLRRTRSIFRLHRRSEGSSQGLL
jgi:hypothetical protein